jgi:hypothetical protein
VRRAGDRVRITVQLIEAATDTHLWAETYDRDLTDVFAIQTVVAKRIASAMEVELTGATAERLALEPTRNLEAYDLYLTARTLPGTIDGFKARIELNREAVTLPMIYARSYMQPIHNWPEAVDDGDNAKLVAKYPDLRDVLGLWHPYPTDRDGPEVPQNRCAGSGTGRMIGVGDNIYA